MRDLRGNKWEELFWKVIMTVGVCFFVGAWVYAILVVAGVIEPMGHSWFTGKWAEW